MLVYLLKIIDVGEIALSRPTEYFRIRRLYYNCRRSTSAFWDCTTSAHIVLPRSEIVLLVTEWNIPILRLHYFGRFSTSAFRDCTTSAHIVLPRSEIVLQRPTEYFRVRRLYYHGRQSTSAFWDCTTTADRVLPRFESVLWFRIAPQSYSLCTIFPNLKAIFYFSNTNLRFFL